jgi:hypothetical protein
VSAPQSPPETCGCAALESQFSTPSRREDCSAAPAAAAAALVVESPSSRRPQLRMQSTVSPPKPGPCHLSACITPCGVSGVPQGHCDHVRKGGRKPPYPPCPSAGLASRGRGGARGGLLRSCKVSNFEFACLRLHKVRAASSACCDWPGPRLLAPFHSSLPPPTTQRGQAPATWLSLPNPTRIAHQMYATPWLVPLRRSGMLGPARSPNA